MTNVHQAILYKQIENNVATYDIESVHLVPKLVNFKYKHCFLLLYFNNSLKRSMRLTM